MSDLPKPHLVRNDGESPTPASALPAISDTTVVRVSLRVLWAGGAALVGFTVWLAVMHADVQWLKQAMRDLQHDVRELGGQKVAKP